jgi:hypothetical protein
VDVVAGYDGTNVQVVKTDVNGIVQTAVNGTAAVSAASLAVAVLVRLLRRSSLRWGRPVRRRLMC